MSREQPGNRYAKRLALLERLSERLTALGVPHILYRHLPNGAPSPGDAWTMPVIDVRAGWRQIKVLYWDRQPRFAYRYAYSRYPVDDTGIDRLALRVAVDYENAHACTPT